MKKLIAVTLLALVCWAVPINWIWAKTTDKPKQIPWCKPEVRPIKSCRFNPDEYTPKQISDWSKPPEDYLSEDILIKDNAIQPSSPNTATISNAQLQRTTSIRSSLPSGRDYSGKAYSKEDVQHLIRDYSVQYGIPADTPLCIAKLESGFNQFSKNKSSTASGVFQYLSSTWAATDEGRAGLSVFDADANIRAAIKYMASRKSTKPWVVGPRCPSLN